MKTMGTTLYETQHLTLPFRCRNQAGNIRVTMQPNNDLDHAWGLDLIFPSVPQLDFPRQFFGFPVIQAKIDYPIPPSSSAGYGNLLGWIQLVKAGDPNSFTQEGLVEWEMDIYPSFSKDSNSPFAIWGHNPTMFDAPARLLSEDGKEPKLAWRAQSFLCVIRDAGMTRQVELCRGGSFSWGFDIEVTRSGEEQEDARNIVVKTVEPLDLEQGWNERLSLLRSLYPDWGFQESKTEDDILHK
ncbi:hypothetical protein G7Y89_g7667 [Cudoniella acicularis]|uniref:Uncharacterized protein n=1 Tax=Cudoniella acicularis TaxID=354080 RepID=A0A8H4RI27_9HELO|nr:hypothetical protein G7Y89_g7667 [Cudoniella acicularis]